MQYDCGGGSLADSIFDHHDHHACVDSNPAQREPHVFRDRREMPGHRFTEGLYEALHRRGVMQIFFCLGLLVYLFSRVYLVLECFISLLHSPVEVYDLPAWSAYVPHIT